MTTQHTHVIDMLQVMPSKKRKDEGIFIRLDAKEKKALQLAASGEERSVADWARRLFRRNLREMGLLPEPEEKTKTKE